MSATTTEARVYTDSGNPQVVARIDPAAVDVLDVGCGSGDTAALLRARDPHKRIDGITSSFAEADAARAHVEHVWIADLEQPLPEALLARRYDVLVLAHVLEHLREPEVALARLTTLLRPGGRCVIAVPNVMVYKQRWQFVLGRFDYQARGIMDETHLRFYSYDSAPRLLSRTPELQLQRCSVNGHAPLALARRLLPSAVSAQLDAAACHYWPNLFGGEILLECEKQASATVVVTSAKYQAQTT